MKALEQIDILAHRLSAALGTRRVRGDDATRLARNGPGSELDAKMLAAARDLEKAVVAIENAVLKIEEAPL